MSERSRRRFSVVAGERPPAEGGEPAGRRARRRLAVLPSLLTMANAVCGFAAIVQIAALRYDPASHTILNPENLTHACWLVLLGMLFDGVDGRIARMTETAGEFGGELDSLCDVVTFGVAPGLMVAMLNASAIAPPLWAKTAWLLGLAYACCAILRLARFNVENAPEAEAHQRFRGLPSPAAAGTIVTLVLLMRFLESERAVLDWLPAGLVAAVGSAVPVLLPFMALATGWLMVSRVPYVHVGNRYLRGRRSPAAIARLVLIGIVCFAILPEVALAIAFGGYALSGPLGLVWRRVRGEQGPELEEIESEPADEEGWRRGAAPAVGPHTPRGGEVGEAAGGRG